MISSVRAPAVFPRALLPIIFGGMTVPLGAYVVMLDSFTDAGRTDGVDGLDAEWIGGYGANAAIRSSEGDYSLAGNNYSGVWDPTIFGRMPSAISLGAGESVELEFKVKFVASTSVTQTFSFGLFNDKGSTITENDSPVVGGRFFGQDLEGYFASVRTYDFTTPENALYYESGGTMAAFYGTDRTRIGSVGTTEVGYGPSPDYSTAMLRITNSGGSVLLDGYYDGIQFASESLVAPGSPGDRIAFNQVGLNFEENPRAYYEFDDVKVTYNFVPEATSSLALVGGILFLGLRRRRTM